MIESKYLKNDIKNIQRLLVIPTLQKFEQESLGRLLKLSKIRQYDRGECIIREGDQDPWLYFLLSGKVRVEKEGVEIFQINKIGDLFGEMRVVDNSSRSASIYAETPATCLAINTSGKKGFGVSGSGDRDVEFLLVLYRIFSEFVSIRLRITNEELIQTKKEIEELKQHK
jgi:CRP/FNR family transcriptional regulator, cyclic AMP receptor protein